MNGKTGMLLSNVGDNDVTVKNKVGCVDKKLTMKAQLKIKIKQSNASILSKKLVIKSTHLERTKMVLFLYANQTCTN